MDYKLFFIITKIKIKICWDLNFEGCPINEIHEIKCPLNKNDLTVSVCCFRCRSTVQLHYRSTRRWAGSSRWPTVAVSVAMVVCWLPEVMRAWSGCLTSTHETRSESSKDTEGENTSSHSRPQFACDTVTILLLRSRSPLKLKCQGLCQNIIQGWSFITKLFLMIFLWQLLLVISINVCMLAGQCMCRGSWRVTRKWWQDQTTTQCGSGTFLANKSWSHTVKTRYEPSASGQGTPAAPWY